MKQRLYNVIDSLIKVYHRLRIKKTYWSIAVPFCIFFLGELTKLAEPLVKWIELLSKETENGLLKLFLQIIATYLSFEIPGWITGLLLVIFAIISGIRIFELRSQSNQVDGKSEEIYSEITGGDSYLKLEIRHDKSNPSFFKVSGIIEDERGGLGKYNLRIVDIQIFVNKKKIFETLNPIQELGAGSVLDFKSIKLPVPINQNPILYSIQILSKNGKYFQYALLKKFKDGNWYGHTVYFNDLYKRLFRKEEYFPYSYPEELKRVSPKMDELIKFERDNKTTIELAKKMLKNKTPIDFIINSTGLTKKQIERMK
jgi:hypothetical protein